jgi:hypothetical protein
MGQRIAFVSAVIALGLGVSSCAADTEESRAEGAAAAVAEPFETQIPHLQPISVIDVLLSARHPWEKQCANTAFPTYAFVATKGTAYEKCNKTITVAGGKWVPEGFLRDGHTMCNYHWESPNWPFGMDRDVLESHASKNFIGEPDVYADCLGNDRTMCSNGAGSCRSATSVVGTVRTKMIDDDDDANGNPTPNLGMAGCPKCGMIRNDKLHVVLPPEFLLDDEGKPATLYALGRDKTYISFKAPRETQLALITNPSTTPLTTLLRTPEGEPIYITPMPVDKIFD